MPKFHLYVHQGLNFPYKVVLHCGCEYDRNRKLSPAPGHYHEWVKKDFSSAGEAREYAKRHYSGADFQIHKRSSICRRNCEYSLSHVKEEKPEPNPKL